MNSKSVQGDRSDPGDEAIFVPLPASVALPETASGPAGGEWDTEEDKDALGDGPDRDLHRGGRQPQPTRQELQVEVGEGGEGNDLE